MKASHPDLAGSCAARSRRDPKLPSMLHLQIAPEDGSRGFSHALRDQGRRIASPTAIPARAGCPGRWRAAAELRPWLMTYRCCGPQNTSWGAEQIEYIVCAIINVLASRNSSDNKQMASDREDTPQ